jgi:quercetin dioxygenase-like cupin family protein
MGDIAFPYAHRRDYATTARRLRRARRAAYAGGVIFRRLQRRSQQEEEAMPVKAGVVRAGSRQTRRGAAETFTGVVFQDPVVVAEAPSRMGGSVVTFTPGARTAWHSHPVGQTLYCLSGIGRICFKGEKPQVLSPGDVVNIPPETMHWHGASPDRLFAHLALSEAGEQGQGATWGAHVSDAEYNEVASGG